MGLRECYSWHYMLLFGWIDYVSSCQCFDVCYMLQKKTYKYLLPLNSKMKMARTYIWGMIVSYFAQWVGWSCQFSQTTRVVMSLHPFHYHSYFPLWLLDVPLNYQAFDKSHGKSKHIIMLHLPGVRAFFDERLRILICCSSRSYSVVQIHLNWLIYCVVAYIKIYGFEFAACSLLGYCSQQSQILYLIL